MYVLSDTLYILKTKVTKKDDNILLTRDYTP